MGQGCGKSHDGVKGDARGERTRMLWMYEYNCEIIILYRKNKYFWLNCPPIVMPR